MLEAPIGAAAYNNEFGRPNLCGYFRAFEMGTRGYHKPIMLAGGLGALRAQHAHKNSIAEGDLLLQLGGPGMLIGMGGGAASSMGAGANAAPLPCSAPPPATAACSSRIRSPVRARSTSRSSSSSENRRRCCAT